MSVDIGDVYPLSVLITDANNQPANAGTMTLTVYLPDGTDTGGIVVPPTTTGQYDHDHVTTQHGTHLAKWVATGTNSSAYSEVFDVRPYAENTFVSLKSVRDHMRKTIVTDNEKLREFIDGACQVITDRVGQVAPITVTEDIRPSWKGMVKLSTYPVASIVSIQTLPGLVAVPAANLATPTAGWYSDNLKTGILRHTASWPAYVRAVYRAGTIPVPSNYILAAKELSAHIWRVSQMNPNLGRPTGPTDEVTIAGVTFALPLTVRQLLGIDKRPRKGLIIG